MRHAEPLGKLTPAQTQTMDDGLSSDVAHDGNDRTAGAAAGEAASAAAAADDLREDPKTIGGGRACVPLGALF